MRSGNSAIVIGPDYPKYPWAAHIRRQGSMSVTITEPSFVAVNAAVLTGTVVSVPPPALALPEYPVPCPAQQLPSSKRRNLNDGRKWLAALLLITAAGGAAAVVLNPALRPATLTWSSLSPVADQPRADIPPPPTAALPAPPLPLPPAPARPIIAAPSPIVDNPRPSPADDAQLLWQSALNAESHRDFATAVKLYERLESLPDTDWPPGLHVRRQLAQQELVAGLH
jgi:hypothetical protein